MLRSDRSGRETVAAVACGGDRYRLLDSPVTGFGCAAGDVIEVAPDGSFEVVERGGRVSVQVFAASHGADIARDAVAALEADGITLESRFPAMSAFAFSLPQQVGAKRVRGVMAALEQKYPGFEWVFASAHHPDGSGTLLPWAKAFFAT